MTASFCASPHPVDLPARASEPVRRSPVVAPRRWAAALALLVALVVVAAVTASPAHVVGDGRRVTAALLAAVVPATAGWGRAELELAGNVALFVPLGLLGVLATGARWAWLVVAAGGVLSVAVEVAQGYLAGRVSDPVDVASNTAGAVLGAVVAVGACGVITLSRWALNRLVPEGPVAMETATGATAPSSASGHRGSSRSSAGRPPRPRRRVVLTLALAMAAVGVLALGVMSPGGGVPLSSVVRDLIPLGATADDGRLPASGASPFDEDPPGIARLDPGLRAAVQAAARAAAEDGVEVLITSGWRSADYQQELLDRAKAEHGEGAGEYVLAPERSAHVLGRAVDVGATDAAYWMAQHGSEYGLCQTYVNEVWHYELATAAGPQCPEPLSGADARG